jgi:hypothetical protein
VHIQNILVRRISACHEQLTKMCTFSCIHANIHTKIHANKTCICTYIHTHIHTYSYLCSRRMCCMGTDVCTYINIHTCIHTHICALAVCSVWVLTYVHKPNPVQPRLCNAKNAIFKRLKTGFSLRLENFAANSNSISFTYIHQTHTFILTFVHWQDQTHMHTYICALAGSAVLVLTYVHTNIHTDIHTYIHTHICALTVCSVWVLTYVRACIHTSHKHKHTYILTFMHWQDVVYLPAGQSGHLRFYVCIDAHVCMYMYV